jgi:N-methylhydantoinase A
LALMPFGGAGPLHAAALAAGLGISRVVCPRASGVLSALGLAAAPPRRDAARTVMLSGEQLDGRALERAREELVAEAAAALGAEPRAARVRHELRYRGQSFELPVDEERGRGAALSAGALREAFADTHEARYGYRDEQAEVELVNLRASVWGRAPRLEPRAGPPGAAPGLEETEIVFAGRPLAARLLRGDPAPGAVVDGPALFALAESTLLVAPGWRARVDEQGTIAMSRTRGEGS